MAKRHGFSYSRTYMSWQNAKKRCHSPSNPAFGTYGARGIHVCESWRNSFANFLADMGECPDGHTLDRLDNSHGYEPGNCRWATPKEQSQNSAKPRIITFEGESLNITEWARRLGIAECSMHERLKKWPLEKALTTKKLTTWPRRFRAISTPE